jgi:hypothetical protein
MPPKGFETAIPAREGQYIYALDRGASGFGCIWICTYRYIYILTLEFYYLAIYVSVISGQNGNPASVTPHENLALKTGHTTRGQYVWFGVWSLEWRRESCCKSVETWSWQLSVLYQPRQRTPLATRNPGPPIIINEVTPRSHNRH